MARVNVRRKYSKYADECFWVPDRKVVKIDYQNQPVGDKVKTCFYCESDNEDGVMCIAWGRTTFEVGDIVTMKGRLNDGIFLVWSLNYKRQEKKNED